MSAAGSQQFMGDRPRRILVVFNPAAGTAKLLQLRHVVALVRGYGCFVEVRETSAPGHAKQIAQEASATDFDVIAAAGGDGTINEIINGIKEKSIAVGVIPLGTANVVAREIGLELTPESIACALACGPIRDINVGCANGRRFIMMAGVGFDANVVDAVSLNLKRRIGPLAYIWQAIKESVLGRTSQCFISVDGANYEAASVIVCNGQRYGGPFVAIPLASLSDEMFYVVLMKGRGLSSVLRYGVALIFGRLSKLSDVEVVPGRVIQINGIDGHPVQADGDIITRLPASIKIDGERVKFVYPG